MTRIIVDPHSATVDAIAGEEAVPAERITPDALRRRFRDTFVWTPEVTDEHRLRAAGGPCIEAAVLIPIVLRQDGATLLLTQRTAHLSTHAGQVSFPGGRREEGDSSLVDTALRETEEETGLDRRHVEVIGSLPDYVTVTGYRVMPVVALVTPPFPLQPDPQEVAEIFEVPLAYLMNGAHHERRSVSLPDNGGRRSFYAIAHGRFLIWGATAGMLRNLFHFLRA